MQIERVIPTTYSLHLHRSTFVYFIQYFSPLLLNYSHVERFNLAVLPSSGRYRGKECLYRNHSSLLSFFLFFFLSCRSIGYFPLRVNGRHQPYIYTVRLTYIFVLHHNEERKIYPRLGKIFTLLILSEQ